MTGSFWEYFLFHGLAGFYIYLGLKASVLLVQDSFRFFTRNFGHCVHTSCHSNCCPKTDFLIPISADEKGCYFHFRILANHLASFFFPVRRFLWTNICPVYPFLYPSGHRVQTSVGFHSDLDLLLRLREIDLHSYSSF